MSLSWFALAGAAAAAPVVEGTCPLPHPQGVVESICLDQFRLGHDIVFADGEPLQVCMTGGNEVCRRAVRVDAAADGKRTAYDRHDLKLVSYRMSGSNLDGPFTAWATDGSVAIDGVFRAGRREGTWKEWKDGKLAITAVFRDGVLDGTAVAPFAGVELRIAFEHGVRVGKYAAVDLQGYSSTVQPIRLDIVTEGSVTYLDRVSIGKLVNGKRHGVWETRHRSGALLGEETYRDGERDGPSWRTIGPLREFVPWRAGKPHGWGQIVVGGVSSRRLWENGEVVEVYPRPPAYAWRGAGADVTAGPMVGRTTSIQMHVDVAHVWGSAGPSRDGERVSGRYVAMGGELVLDAPVGGLVANGTVGAGSSFELGYAFGGRDAEGRNRPSRVFVRTVASVTNEYDVRARIGVGIDSPAWTVRAARGAASASDAMMPGHCAKKSDGGDDGCLGFLSMWFIPLVWLAAPVWSLNHIELTAEVGSDHHTRYGVLIGWGL